jgi:hypothetical protein
MSDFYDCSEEFALDAVSKCGLVYFWLPGPAKTFKVKEAAVNNDFNAMQFIFPDDATVAVDEEYLQILTRALLNGLSLKDVPVAYRRLPSIVRAAVERDPLELKHAILDVTEDEYDDYDDKGDTRAQYAYSDAFEDDGPDEEDSCTFEQLSEKEQEKHNKLYVIVRKAVRANGLALWHAKKFMFYRSIVLAAHLQNPNAAQNCDSPFVRKLVRETETKCPGLLAQVARVVLGEEANEVNTTTTKK